MQSVRLANGHTRDRQGRLIGCSRQHRCITQTELDGRITVLADSYRGQCLNSLNDVVCRSDGSIWFGDPVYGIARLIPALSDQNPRAQSRNPMDMMRQGWLMSLFQASQQ